MSAKPALGARSASNSGPRGKLGSAVILIAAILTAAWFTGAVWFQSTPPWRAVWIACPWLVAVAVLVLSRKRGILFGGLTLVLALGIGALWWSSFHPSNDRDWAPDVAHGVTAEIGAREVVVHNIRAFDWITETKAVETWKSASYDPDTITSLDLASSVWSSPAIAHTVVTFGFADGRHLVFSGETRRTRSQEFSALGGFFKEFELILLAGEETDFLRLRTNVRKERLSLYPLRAKRENMKALFLSYLARGNQLARQPEFYNTLTTNCTTVIADLARHTGTSLPFDWRILVSGYLPDYLYERGAIRTNLPFSATREAAMVSQIAQEAAPGANYSETIRSGPLYRAAP